MAKPKVDGSLCIGCGVCTTICPNVFEMGSDGKSRVKEGAGCEGCDCESAKSSCPVGAISIE